jgi:hypothetical protein
MQGTRDDRSSFEREIIRLSKAGMSRTEAMDHLGMAPGPDPHPPQDAPDVAELHRELAETYARLHKAEAEAAAAKQDAERYRWLRENAVGSAMHMGAVLYTPELVVPHGWREDHAKIDSAIDAALAGEK